MVITLSVWYTALRATTRLKRQTVHRTVGAATEQPTSRPPPPKEKEATPRKLAVPHTAVGPSHCKIIFALKLSASNSELKIG